MSRRFRVAGPIEWVSQKLSLGNARTIACLSSEPRTLSSVYRLSGLGRLGHAEVIDLDNRFASRFSHDYGLAKAERLSELRSLSLPHTVRNLDFLDNLVEIRNLAREVADDDTVVVDISTMPKRVFFPLIKFLLRNPPDRLRTLVATYATPLGYPPADEPLVEQLMPMAPLPSFNPDVTEGSAGAVAGTAKIVVGLGFEIGTLPDFISSIYPQPDLTVLFPIPPGPPHIHRNHELLRQLRVALGRADIDVRHVSSLEVAESFDVVCSEARGGPLDLAPYGPKPLSLGMCLAAIRHDSAVYYAQPRAYNPRYTVGGDYRSGTEVTAYPIRVNGEDWY